MQYESVNDVKQMMKNILDSLDPKSDYYNDFKWFSKVNYTTTTEYYGELRIFLLQIQRDNRLKSYQNDLQELYEMIDKTLFPKEGNH